MSVIQAEGLVKVYPTSSKPLSLIRDWMLPNGCAIPNGRIALQGISFQIEPGDSVGVIGPNGAGKSTLLKILAGISSLTDGDLTIRGTVGAVLSLGAAFHPDYSGLQNIRTIGMLLGWTREETQTKLSRIVEFSELGSAIREPLRSYSSGMRARLGFSVMTEVRADILAIDEVLAVGDSYFARKCIRYLQEMNARGTTLLLASHSLFLVQQLCQKTMWLDEGKLVAYDQTSCVCNAYEKATWEKEDRQLVSKNTEGQSDQTTSYFGRSTRDPGNQGWIWKKIVIERVELFDQANQPRACFLVGDVLVVRIYYSATINYPRPNVGITIERLDGLVVSSASMHDDSYDGQDVKIGSGFFEVIYDPIVFAPATYHVHVSITLDGSLALGDTNFDYVSHVQEFKVWSSKRSYSVAVMPPMQWRHEIMSS